jgi:hypothetical protein
MVEYSSAQTSSEIVVGTLISHSVLQLATMIVALATIYFGYRLFYLSETKSTAEFEASGALGKVRLAKAAPGVFFTLFGCLVLVVALFHPVEFQLSPGPVTPGKTAAKVAHPDDRASASLSATGAIAATSEIDPAVCAKTIHFLAEDVRSSPDYQSAIPVRRQLLDQQLRQGEEILAICVDRALNRPGIYRLYKLIDKRIQVPGGNNDVTASDDEAYRTVSKLLAL